MQDKFKLNIELYKEADRIEESALFSSKGHFYASNSWRCVHYVLGISLIVLGFVMSILLKNNLAIVISSLMTAISILITFLNPQEKFNSFLNSAKHYDNLFNDTRFFKNITLESEKDKKILKENLKFLFERKKELNTTSPQIPYGAYKKSKKAIEENGEAEFKADKEK